MEASIVIITDRIRYNKLSRLLSSIKPQLDSTKHKIEILLLHESNKELSAPDLPVKVKYINIKEKQGFSYNRNRGISNAKHSIIIFIDDDCWVQDNWLNSLLMPFENDPNILATTSGTHIPRSNFLGDCISALGFPGGGSIGFSKMWKVSKNGFTNHLTVGNCALRKSLFKIVGLFDESMKSGAEDAEFSFRMEKVKIPIKYVKKAYAFHEARTTLKEFIKWQLRRGRANYQFKQKVGPIEKFIKLRLWSTRNIFKKNLTNPALPIIFLLLGLSFILQQYGFILEKKHFE